MINPGEIPQISGDVEAVAASGGVLKENGRAFARTGADVHATWQGLAAFYKAPEAGQLFAATGPVKTSAEGAGADITAVGSALATYADEVRPLKAQLASLQSSASTFVASASADEDWRKDGDKVDAHNALLSGVNTAVAAWMDAQRRCANAINALYGGTQWAADNGDATQEANEFGYSSDQLQAATASEQGVPWGRPEEEDLPWWKDALHVGGSVIKGVVVDGAWTAVKGLWGLVNFTDWETFSTTWKGLGKVALSLSLPLQVINHFTALPGLEKGELGRTLKEFVKGFLAWDQWGDDPGRAFGNVLFNVVTLGFGGGAVARATGTAGRVGKVGSAAGRVASVIRVAELARTLKLSMLTVRPARLSRLADDLRVPLPKNDPALPKSSPRVAVQVAEVRLHLSQALQKTADGAWQAAKQRAATAGVPATAQRLGTYAHAELSHWIRAHHGALVDETSGYRIRSEISFDVSGGQVRAGTSGSVRPDIVIERQFTDAHGRTTWQVVHVIDYKTGKTGIASAWRDKVLDRLNPIDKPEELRPNLQPAQ